VGMIQVPVKVSRYIQWKRDVLNSERIRLRGTISERKIKSQKLSHVL
jgi:hypothetical protein